MSSQSVHKSNGVNRYVVVGKSPLDLAQMKLFVLLVSASLAPSLSEAGQYRISYQWPSGIHENMDWMQPSNEAACRAVEADLMAIGPLAASLSCETPLGNTAGVKPLTWSPVPKEQVFAVAKKLEKLQEEYWGHDSGKIESDEFSRQLASGIASGEVTISFASAPVATIETVWVENGVRSGPKSALDPASSAKISILRYQRWGCGSPAPGTALHGRVVFFRGTNGDIENLKLIGPPDHGTVDAFVVNGWTYTYEISDRDFDNRWQRLPKTQPVLFVDRFVVQPDGQTRRSPVCRLLYWQDWKELKK
jgi:hypothetical protein